MLRMKQFINATTWSMISGRDYMSDLHDFEKKVMVCLIYFRK